MVDKSPVCRLSHFRARVTTTVKATVMSTAIQTGRQTGRQKAAVSRRTDYLHSCTLHLCKRSLLPQSFVDSSSHRFGPNIDSTLWGNTDEYSSFFLKKDLPNIKSNYQQQIWFESKCGRFNFFWYSLGFYCWFGFLIRHLICSKNQQPLKLSVDEQSAPKKSETCSSTFTALRVCGLYFSSARKWLANRCGSNQRSLQHLRFYFCFIFIFIFFFVFWIHFLGL